MAQSNNFHILSNSPINFSDTSYINAVIPGLFFIFLLLPLALTVSSEGFKANATGEQRRCAFVNSYFSCDTFPQHGGRGW